MVAAIPVRSNESVIAGFDPAIHRLSNDDG
jgi:hypothetical protein